MLFISRFISIAYALLIAISATQLSAQVFFADGKDILDYVRIALLAISSAWIAWGGSMALGGLLFQNNGSKNAPQTLLLKPENRTAILVPVYNEDPSKTFSHIAAMVQSLEIAEAGRFFDFAILSDTNQPDVIATEEQWFDRLSTECQNKSNIFYRRRDNNVGKKAGNIEDFIRTSGAAYEYLIILDADSLMEGDTLIEMVNRMESDPEIGLFQTLPKVIRARTWFGRSIQFAANYFSPSFARGLASTQGTEGPFWGHNAIVRTHAFATSCGLPALKGKPPFGGHILSHDYVEAALLSRAGWKVIVDPELQGSYEEGPENIIDFAKRDRRWCQGNLQHTRLVGAPGLTTWCRFTFTQGIMAYLASPLWALFIIASIIAPTLVETTTNYFPNPGQHPVFPVSAQTQAFTLIIGVLVLLIGPKFLIVLRGLLTGENRNFGGSLIALWSTFVEIIWSSIFAPIMLMFQTRAFLEIVLGKDGGWPASNREADTVGLKESFQASWWITLSGLAIMTSCWFLAPQLIYWFMPIAVPQIFSSILITLSSSQMSGKISALMGIFWTPMEYAPSDVMQIQTSILTRWLEETDSNSPDETQTSDQNSLNIDKPSHA
ncbi:glucans biosynthesis glucosyltransferase MdoH [Hirschia baltica]|uniref:Glucans biosynthesis glucosyltransferase H n=1 Tax=Hirschia baltica (strain ATCC 49814 / DSM 5838 / IFAM 1418) TaxID=582402 RepID=C6XLL1_HIRBI|nr:glucans biosynthesis glucosyltransferase MdoH [Hirschia baltica]ACT57917.1 glycosyl transferase family 2 [Hirschia baltica ATCC 49814]